MSAASVCGCRICTGDMPDRPMEGGLSKCPHCDVPMSYGDTHRGDVVRLDTPGGDDGPTLAHRNCLGEEGRRLFGVVVYPRDSVKP